MTIYNFWIKKSILPGIILFSLLFSTCRQPGQDTITILHTNDLHSQYLPAKASWIRKNPKPLIGGMEALYHYVQKEKNTKTLLLDAGDTQTGTPLSGIEYKEIKGGGFIEMMNLIDYHASVLGNHEFDSGYDNLKKLMDLAEFNWLSANLYKGEKLFARQATQIYRIGTLKVGVIGLTIEHLYGLVPSKNLNGLKIKPVIETAQEWIDRLDPKTDLIVLLTHHGFELDTLLAASVQGADIIVGGHSHTRLKSPVKVNNIYIVQAGSRNQNLGRVQVTVRGDTVLAFEGSLIPMWADSIPDNAMTVLVDSFKQVINQEYGEIIGTMKANWSPSYYNRSPLGTYITEVIRKYAQTDFGLINSGGIRRGLYEGPVRKLDIVEILPFSNHIVRFQCKGSHIIQLIETNASAQAKHAHGSLQYAGIDYQIHKDKDNVISITNMRINGQAIYSDSIYTGSSVDYVLYDNADRYMGFVPAAIENTGILLSELIINHIKKNPIIQ